MRVLVTGATGFAGRHLIDRLLAARHEVFGTSRGGPPTRIRPTRLQPDHLLVSDVCDPGAVAAVVRRVQPDALFHLAAFTSVAASFHDPLSAYRANLFGSLNVFAAVLDAARPCRIVWVGSSDAYGQVNADELPVTETNPFRPLSPYGVSKAAADLAAFQWSRSRGLDVVRVRPFNHTGPGQQPEFVCADFAAQIIATQQGQRPAQIDVGNLDVVRDFTDVRDVVAAYLALWEHGQRGEAYNVCSGRGRSPRQILERLIQLSGADVQACNKSERQRPADVPVLIGSPDKLRATTGWAPTIDFDQTLCDLLEDWRQRLAVGGRV